MKQMIVLLAASFMFAGCASKAVTTDNTTVPAEPAVHQDYKGEVGSNK